MRLANAHAVQQGRGVAMLAEEQLVKLSMSRHHRAEL